jgi:Immunoglobulin I-set domain
VFRTENAEFYLAATCINRLPVADECNTTLSYFDIHIPNQPFAANFLDGALRSISALGDLSDASASATGDVPPKFTQLLKDIEGTEGELVRFECRVIGHPTPVIKWFRGRTQIQNSPEFQVR